MTDFSRDEKGFVLNGLALLLILPAMLLASSYIVIVAEGGEIASIQTTAESVSSTGKDVRATARQMDLYNLKIDNQTLDNIAQEYEKATGLTVNMWENNYKIYIIVKDPGGTAKYETVVDRLNT